MKPIYLTIFSLIFFTHQVIASDYYWVGGTGNWSDISHWATTSGGTITHSQAPTADDDVYFDANSFSAPGQTVTLNTAIIFFRNMDWSAVTNNPVFIGDENITINCFGGVMLSASMTYSFQGDFNLASNNNGNNLDFANHNVAQNIFFDGQGEWVLFSDITVDSVVLFNEGSLNTNGQNVDCQYFNSGTTNTRNLVLGASNITITGGYTDPFLGFLPDNILKSLWLVAENLTMDGGTSTITLTNPQTYLWVEGPGDLDFHRVELTASNGSSRIFPWTGDGAPVPNAAFVELDLFHETELQGQLTIGELTLHPNQRYYFESAQIFNIDALDAVGNCIAGISIQGTNDGEAAIFNSPNNITTDFVSMMDIAVQGAGIFTADNAVDLGNNSGWTINPRLPADYFWIGGTGDWDDPAHWALSSGGVSSGCIPTSIDNVFFDANSFDAPDQVVMINVEDAYCRSMDWTGATNNPTLDGPMNFDIHIGGSLTLIPNMEHAYAGIYSFESTNLGNTIDPAGHIFNWDANFTGETGEWIFQSPVVIANFLNFNSGTIRTNDQNVTLFRLYGEGTAPRGFYLGNSYITLQDNGQRPAEWYLGATNLTFDAGTSIIESVGPYSNLIWANGDGTIIYNTIISRSYELRYFSLIDPPFPSVTVDSLIFYQDGFFSGDNEINYLFFAPGHRYDLVSNSTQTINELAANGTCEEGLVYISTSNTGFTTDFNIANNHTLERLFLRGIQQVGTGNLTANNSIDADYNLNWNFNESTGRTLYWIGDAGDWNDQVHWSLSSGGAGGECIPTPIDDVIFDANSFSTASPLIDVDILNDIFFRHMTWETGITQSPIFRTRSTNMFGSLLIESEVNFEPLRLYCVSEEDETIMLNGNSLNCPVFFEGGASYTLLDAFDASFIRHLRGTLNTNNQNVRTADFMANGIAADKTLILGDSYVLLYGESLNAVLPPFSIFSEGMVIEPGNSTIEFSGSETGIRMDYSLLLHNVFFSNPASSAKVDVTQCTFNSMTFYGNATFLESSTTDTLFCAPGKVYVMESALTQFVNEYWQIIGNNCTPIELVSSVNGQLANVQVPANGNILADFIQMRDINALGGADFLAGAHSTDISNSNIGWTFDSAPEFIDIGFLGTDLALCDGEPITISAYSYSPGETYLWQDGSTDTTFVATQSGLYHALVTFEDNCEIRDTIQVFAGEDFQVDLGLDINLCEGDATVLNPGITVPGASYLWQDGSTASTLEASVAGEYFVIVDVSGCIESDTIMVAMTNYPSLDLGEDLSACAGDEFTLDANDSADTYLWQDASTGSSFTGNSAGIYWLEMANGNCAVRDSVEVIYIDAGAIDLGVDTTICDEQNYVLNVAIPNANYTWQDGSVNNQFTANASGEYWVVADVQGCQATDTIQLVFQDNPAIEFGDEIFACQGDVVHLSSPVVADGYLWSDGDVDEDFSTTLAGLYYLDATFGECIVREYFEVILAEIPVIIEPLGPDTMLCPQNTYTLSANTNIGTISWQDGSALNNFIVNAPGEYWFVADNMGCTSSDTIEVAYLTTPDLGVVGNYESCEDVIFSLTANLGADSYSWTNGDVGTIFTGNQSGTYSLNATYGDCLISEEFSLDVIPLPIIDLGMDIDACEDENITLDAGQMAVWQDGSMSQNFVPLTSGLYFAEVANGNCIESDTVTVAITNYPSLDLGEDLSACAGDEFTLDANDSADTYLWQDASIGSSFTGNSAGIYWLEMANGNCAVRDSVEVIYIDAGAIDLGADTTICDEQNYVLNVAIPNANYTWQDGSVNNQLTANASGEYWVVADVQGCQATDTIQLVFQDNPTIEFGDEIFACQGDVVHLSSPVVADSYLWSDGDVDEDFSTTLAGLYYLDATFGECIVREYFEVILAEIPVIIEPLAPDTTLCPQSTYTLSANTNIGTISWQDGSALNNFIVNAPGEYWFVADNMGCTSSDTIEVAYLTTPDLGVAGNYESCEDVIFSLTANLGADSYSWTNGDVGTIFTDNQSGTYSLNATYGDCLISEEFSLDVIPLPFIDFGMDIDACEDENIILDAGQMAVWQDGSMSQNFVPLTSGLYFAEAANGNCINRDSVNITISPLPVFDLGADQNDCEGETITLQIPISDGTPIWDDGSATQQRDISQSGTYWLEVENDAGCVYRDSVVMNFAALPFIELGADTVVCDNVPFSVSAQTGMGSLTWMDGTVGSSFAVNDSGLITASIDNDGCITIDSVFVTFKECTVFKSYIPNVFSPNYDGINDKFLPQFDPALEILDYELQIFNRWGDQLFVSNQLGASWNGTFNGKTVDQGVYIYFIKLTYSDDLGVNSTVLKGDILLLR